LPVEQLDRDRPARDQMPRFEHFAHATGADGSLETIFFTDDRAKHAARFETQRRT